MSGGFDRQVAPVALAQLLQPLKKAAIDQHLGRPGVEQMLRPRHRPRRTEKCQFHRFVFSSTRTVAVAHAAYDQSHLPAGMPEQDRVGVLERALGALARSARPSPWPCRSDRERAPRCAPGARWPRATAASARRTRRRRTRRRSRFGVGERARVRPGPIRSARPDRIRRTSLQRLRGFVGADAKDPCADARQRTAGHEPGLCPAGGSRMHDDVGRRDLFEELRQTCKRGGAERRRRAERDHVGRRPAARSAAATVSISSARASRVGT